MKEETSPEQYWASVEEEIGEKVRAYALARIAEGGTESGSRFFASKPEWGLVFISESALFIDRSSTANWLQRLLTTRRSEEQSERSRISLDSITTVKVPPPMNPLRRLIAGPEIPVTISYTGGSGPLTVVLDRRGPKDKEVLSMLAGLAGDTENA